jgi:translocation and assembly module TamB
MPLGKRKRRILLGLGIFLAGIVVLLVALPLWLPWIMRPIAAKNGARYARFERVGYRRFAVEGLVFTNDAIKLRAQRLEGLVPSVWYWRIISSSTKQQNAFVRVSGWELDIPPSTATKLSQTTKTNQGTASVHTIVHEVADVLQHVKHWIPAATLSNGTLRIESTVLQVPNVDWSQGKAQGQVEWPEKQQRATVVANLTNLPSWQANIDSEGLRLKGVVDFSAHTNMDIVQSTWLWWSNQVELKAQFGRNGVLPETAVVRAPQIRVPAELVRLPGYEEITGSVAGKWEKSQYTVDASAKAAPLRAETNLPPVNAELHGRGDTNAAVIASAIISAPWLKAELSREVTLHYQGQLLREPASLKIAADLSEQPWVKLEGKLSGEADFSPNGEKFPAARFTISGADLGGYGVQAKTLTVTGGLVWPLLVITNANAALDDGSTVAVAGKMDLENRVIEGANLQLNGSLAQRWLPEDYRYEGLSLRAKAEGPLTNLAHSGELEIKNFTSRQTRPLQLKVDWTGEQINLSRAKVSIAASNSTLSTVFSMTTNQTPSLTNIAINLQKLSLQKAGNSVLELQKPAVIVMGKGQTNHWLFQVSEFDWRGPSVAIGLKSKLEWPAAGEAHISGENLQSDLFDDFFNFRTERFEIGKLDTSAGWTNGPLVFRVEIAGSGVIGGSDQARTESRLVRSPVVPQRQLDEGQAVAQWRGPVSLQMLLMGDQNGVAISNLVVNTATSTVASAYGFLPATVNPAAQSNMIDLALDKPLNLNITTRPQSVIWQRLAELTGVVLRQPNLNVDLRGTWQEPNGVVQAEIQEVQLPGTTEKIPKLEELKLDIRLNPQLAKINECNFRLQGQPVTLTGELPLEKSFWSDIKSKKLPDWRTARARLRIERAQISAFQPLLPEYLSPQGQLSLDARLVPGGNFEGELDITGVRTRPFPSVGSIRDIQLSAKLSNFVVRLEKASGLVGGSLVSMKGEGDLRGTDWQKENVPPFNIALRGTNVPLSRQPESVIRSDLNLSVKKTNGAPAIIFGTARLRDSFYLSDLRDLVPGRGVSSPNIRPPYFSIEDEPFADWRLSVHVAGEKALRVRSTLFNGQITPNLRIQGTLKEPVALGDLKVDNGLVRFPFADFQVQQGLVTLSSDNPFQPALLVSAASRRFGYDVKLDVTGTADAPIIQFSSTPPLSSEQLVLMVTAGELPRVGATLSPQQRAQTAALFVGRDLLARWGFGDSSEPRLTITSGQEMSETGRPTYNIEFKLTDRWALEGEYDRFNAYNAGVKWRVYSR